MEKTTGIYRYTLNPEQLQEENKEELKKILVIENLLKKHENLEKWDFKQEIEKSIKSASTEKYTKYWMGDEILLLSTIYCVGQMIKDDWSDKGLTNRLKDQIDILLKNISESHEKTIREDFKRALEYQLKTK